MGAAWALIGLGLGALVRNQVLATVGGIVWLMGVEGVVQGLLGKLGGYLPGQVGLTTVLAPTVGVWHIAVAVMAGYVLMATVAAMRAMRRDVT